MAIEGGGAIEEGGAVEHKKRRGEEMLYSLMPLAYRGAWHKTIGTMPSH